MSDSRHPPCHFLIQSFPPLIKNQSALTRQSLSLLRRARLPARAGSSPASSAHAEQWCGGPEGVVLRTARRRLWNASCSSFKPSCPPWSRSPCPASCSHCPCAFRVWQLTAESEGSRIGRDVKSEGEPFLKDCSDGSLCMWITENYSRRTGDGRLRLLSFSLLIGGILNATTASTLRGMPARALCGRNQCTGVKH